MLLTIYLNYCFKQQFLCSFRSRFLQARSLLSRVVSTILENVRRQQEVPPSRTQIIRRPGHSRSHSLPPQRFAGGSVEAGTYAHCG